VSNSISFCLKKVESEIEKNVQHDSKRQYFQRIVTANGRRMQHLEADNELIEVIQRENESKSAVISLSESYGEPSPRCHVGGLVPFDVKMQSYLPSYIPHGQ
jgi:hypothetical protein